MIMDTVEENGSNASEQTSVSSAGTIVHLISPQTNPAVHQGHIQSSVIQPNQQSVIQTATGIQPVKSVLLVNSKPNSVIHTTHQAIQIKPEPNIGHTIGSDDSDFTDDDSPKKRRDLLTRRPSYRKILNDLGGGEIGGTFLQPSGNPNDHASLQSGGTIVQYSNQDGNLVSYVPVNLVGNNVIAEDQSRKREMRLLKNREAARECRRKKKEYIKCLENRVAVLENQNKALIEELKSLKELYCQQKND
ncbi:cyclic AMP response element-binding protein B isoform X2 [Chironomus tepperi]|uniref:cyclic AMP response element-binding protein B isoform X2 n=1 Tax=Chironomus tepperi TaxID=113505 RepID=UPI00391F7F78